MARILCPNSYQATWIKHTYMSFGVAWGGGGGGRPKSLGIAWHGLCPHKKNKRNCIAHIYFYFKISTFKNELQTPVENHALYKMCECH